MVSYLTTLFLGKPPRGSLPVLCTQGLEVMIFEYFSPRVALYVP